MKQDLIKDVILGMLPYLNNAQNEKLQEVLRYTLAKYEVTGNQNKEKYSEQNYMSIVTRRYQRMIEFTGWTVLILRNVIYIVLNVQKKKSERGLNRMESAEFIFWILEIITM